MLTATLGLARSAAVAGATLLTATLGLARSAAFRVGSFAGQATRAASLSSLFGFCLSYDATLVAATISSHAGRKQKNPQRR